MPPPLITLLTDFGLTDSYVGQMKGAILTVCPAAQLTDLTHSIPPQDVATAARVLAESFDYFPPHTVHVVVVDPGVGTDRGILAVELAGGRVVAPDNGVLTELLARETPRLLVEVTDHRWWRPVVTSTFHGRDIMGPVAAHWASGVDPHCFGSPLAGDPVRLPAGAPCLTAAGRLRGRVRQCDHFGNLLTNIGVTALEQAGMTADAFPRATVRLPERNDLQPLHGIHATYAAVDSGQPLALISSSGCLEIAVRDGSAASWFTAARGDLVEVELALGDCPGTSGLAEGTGQ